MPDAASSDTRLRLADEFPPVSTAEWEAAIAADLRGADYEKKLVWKTDEGIAVRLYYRSGDPPAAAIRRVTRGWSVLQGALPEGTVDARPFHEQGGTAVQELAFALAAASDELAAGRPVSGLAFSTGANYFFEIAKLRAARLLWARLAESYGVGGETLLHASTALEDKSLYDPYSNLLRATTEALSAVLGGADTLAVEPARFSARLAANVERILREEAHVDKVAGPAGGSYYVEALTGALADSAWKLFQEIEAGGGYAAAQAAGRIAEALAASRSAKAKAVGSRRRTLVGVNNYPDLNESALDSAGDLAAASWRLAEPLERVRLRTERHARRAGRRPTVLLLARGDLKMRMARANFCLNFFGCGGFAVTQAETLEDGADLVVLRSRDAEYLALAGEVCPVAGVPVLVAGNPKEGAEELKAARVAGFVHLGSNLVETLSLWQDRLGLEE
jgi:methylmalonyl-CoA mutase